MFIELKSPENYRGKEYEEGDIIEVGAALGERLILNGHKRSSAEAQSGLVNVLSNEEVDALEYDEAKTLVKDYEIETKDNKQVTIKDALKAYFSTIRGE